MVRIIRATDANKKADPVIFLHGGPGAGASPACRGFFNPEHFRIVIIDQGRIVASMFPIGQRGRDPRAP